MDPVPLVSNRNPKPFTPVRSASPAPCDGKTTTPPADPLAATAFPNGKVGSLVTPPWLKESSEKVSILTPGVCGVNTAEMSSVSPPPMTLSPTPIDPVPKLIRSSDPVIVTTTSKVLEPPLITSGMLNVSVYVPEVGLNTEKVPVPVPSKATKSACAAFGIQHNAAKAIITRLINLSFDSEYPEVSQSTKSL